jgi:predicted TIM-barrel fold metal-dependent hydrolase
MVSLGLARPFPRHRFRRKEERKGLFNRPLTLFAREHCIQKERVMDAAHSSKSAAIRARLSHPIIDSDGHQVESHVIFFDFLESVGGRVMAERFKTAFNGSVTDPRWASFSPRERHRLRSIRPTWRAIPARNTRDLATAMLPRLLYDRMDELGLDFSVVYPTLGLLAVNIDDDEVRRAVVRALNRMKVETFAGLDDRLAPVATIPMHTPEEAIAELEYAVGELKLKAVMMASYVLRPIAAAAEISPEAAGYARWLDTFGINSEYNYDPVWAKCVELGVSPTFHSVGYGWGSRRSPTNYIHNHLGNFAASADAVCRGLLMGGVPRRFPNLKFAFMEGGVAWARALYCDLISHWQKRNREAIENYNAERINLSQFEQLLSHYGDGFSARAAEIVKLQQAFMRRGEDPALLDEWEPSGIRSPEDICDIFTRQFYFGCEGDDPLNSLAFEAKGSPFGARLSALYGSDLGHWDVPEMAEAAEEAYELVEHGIISENDLREMVFTNAVEFWTAGNPDFFKGTVIENEASHERGQHKQLHDL